MSSEDWFESWFNTSYYHKLYAHRDDHEAQFFIKNVLGVLPINPQCKLLDLACGRGRHSIFLSENNCDVIGLDLSEKNIEFAKSFETEKLKFEICAKILEYSASTIFSTSSLASVIFKINLIIVKHVIPFIKP